VETVTLSRPRAAGSGAARARGGATTLSAVPPDGGGAGNGRLEFALFPLPLLVASRPCTGPEAAAVDAKREEDMAGRGAGADTVGAADAPPPAADVVAAGAATAVGDEDADGTATEAATAATDGVPVCGDAERAVGPPTAAVAAAVTLCPIRAAARCSTVCGAGGAGRVDAGAADDAGGGVVECGAGGPDDADVGAAPELVAEAEAPVVTAGCAFVVAWVGIDGAKGSGVGATCLSQTRRDANKKTVGE